MAPVPSVEVPAENARGVYERGSAFSIIAERQDSLIVLECECGPDLQNAVDGRSLHLRHGLA